MIKELFVDRIHVKVATSIRARVSDYTVYNDKIYRVVASEGAGIKRSMKLEREVGTSREELWVKGNVTLYKLVEPTGYIRI